jgi:hydroxyacylglutathione hydrolase
VTFSVVEIDTPELGDRSYVVHDGEVALVVDPQRDIDRVLAVTAAVGVKVTHVAETHLHNDYVTGGLALAREVGAEYLVGASEEVSFDRTPVKSGDELQVGELKLSVVATPGHTPGHLAYVVADGERARFVFSGGSLLHGNVGRTDLSGEGTAEALAREQYRSARRLADLPGDVEVHPTHGFGSFCASGPRTAHPAGTIADQQLVNPALLADDEDEFVAALLASFVAYPRYYAHMGPLNAAGPAPIDLSPARTVGPQELRKLLASGEWVIDLRDRTSFARDHLQGSVSFEQSDNLSTYLGWVVPWRAPITLLASTPDRVSRARLDLARIGIDGLHGAASGPLDALAGEGAPRGSYQVSDFGGLAKECIEWPVVVLDVRRDDEWRAGHIEGATHVFVADVPARLESVPPGRVWVHCASGFRASIAASILHKAGRDVVLVDDEWPNVLSSGLPIVPG